MSFAKRKEGRLTESKTNTIPRSGRFFLKFCLKKSLPIRISSKKNKSYCDVKLKSSVEKVFTCQKIKSIRQIAQ